MKELLAKLEQVMQTGVTNRDQANDLLAQCYNAITELVDQLPKPKTDKQIRTEQQRKALEVYCREMAKACSEAGYEFTDFVEELEQKGRKVPWNQALFKDQVWRPWMIYETGKKSTTQLGPEEVTMVYDIVNSRMAEMAGVSMNFPNWRGC